MQDVHNDNFVVSPLALSSILGVIRSGALDETAQEIKISLNYPQNPKEMETLISATVPRLKKSKNIHYVSSMKIFLDNQYPFRSEFKTLAETVYEIELDHFTANTHERAKPLNDFIEAKSEQKIDGFIKDKDIDPSSMMVLVCADYCKIRWSKFHKDASKKRTFKVAPMKAVTVDFLERCGLFNYCESDVLKAQVLELPLEVKFLYLILVLPRDENGLDLMESKLDHVFSNMKYKEERFRLIVPRCTLNFNMDMRRLCQRVSVGS